MMPIRRYSKNSTTQPRTKGMGCAILALMMLGLVFGAACDEEEAFQAFRGAASSSIQSGMKTVADGFIDGLFAVFDQGTGGSADNSSSDSSTTTSDS